jgi:hypothetical protein
MSDDTPTQRFPSTGGDLPTQRLGTAEPQEDLHGEKQKSKGLLIGLIVAGALLLATIIAIILILLPRGSGDPVVLGTETPLPSDSSSPTPSPTPTPTEEPEEPEQPQAPAGPAIGSFTVSNSSVLCNTQSPVPSHQYLAFSWNVSGSSQVFFGVDTNDASTSPLFDNLPQNGTSQADFPAGYNDYEYNCPSASHKYTLTAIDGSGHKVSKSVTVVNNGDTQ